MRTSHTRRLSQSAVLLLGLVIGFVAGVAAFKYQPYSELYQFHYDDYEYMQPSAYSKLGYSFPSSIHVR